MRRASQLDSEFVTRDDAYSPTEHLQCYIDAAVAKERCLLYSLDPERAVKGPILDRFAHVLRRDVDLATGRVRPTGGLVIEIGDGARDFQDAVVGAGAEIQFAHRNAN